MTGGTLSGSGMTLTAVSYYSLRGRRIDACVGTGSVSVPSGQTTVNGTIAANSVSITGGQLQLGQSNRFLDPTTALSISGGGCLILAGPETVGSLQITGSAARSRAPAPSPPPPIALKTPW